jgi:DNA-binding beta-propeller fold protein YncE
MSWGEPGTDPGQFNLPHNLVTDRDGLVYVADRENHRVQIFDGKGGYLGQWNNLHRPCGLFADRGHGLFFVGELGSGMPVTAKTPNLGPRVSVLDAKGQRVARFGGQFASEKPGEFIAPHGLVVDSHGDVYVGEVSWTGYGQFLDPPRVMRSFQKFRRAA